MKKKKLTIQLGRLTPNIQSPIKRKLDLIINDDQKEDNKPKYKPKQNRLLNRLKNQLENLENLIKVEY